MSLSGRGEWPKTGYSVLRAADMTTERRKELWDTAWQIAAVEGVGLGDVRWPSTVRFRSLRSRYDPALTTTSQPSY